MDTIEAAKSAWKPVLEKNGYEETRKLMRYLGWSEAEIKEILGDEN